MRRIEVAVVPLLLWTAIPVAAQTAPPVSDVKPAIVVKVPSAALGAEQVATILLPEGYIRNHARGIPSSICCTAAARITRRLRRVRGFTRCCRAA